jgi:hypothetical protein
MHVVESFKIIFKIKIKVYIPSGSAPSPNEKFWVCTWIEVGLFHGFSTSDNVSLYGLKSEEIGDSMTPYSYVTCRAGSQARHSCEGPKVKELLAKHGAKMRDGFIT